MGNFYLHPLFQPSNRAFSGTVQSVLDFGKTWFVDDDLVVIEFSYQ